MTCVTVTIPRLLDGVAVGAKESLKAEWMYSQSKGRQFASGEQVDTRGGGDLRETKEGEEGAR